MALFVRAGFASLSTIVAVAVSGCCMGGSGATAAGTTTETGSLAAGDSQLQSGEFQDTYTRSFPPGSTVNIRATSADFDTYLIVRPPAGGQQMDNDDYPGTGRDAGVDITGALAGDYTIIVTSFAPGETGSYTLSITVTP